MSFKLCYLNELGPDSPASTMIRVRIVKMFQDYLVNEDTKFGIGYIFVDEKENYMQAKLTPHYESTFKHRLQEQGVYEFSNFRVHSRPGEYNTVKHNHLITFKRDTFIRTIKKSMFNLPTTKPFEFVAFEAIPSMVTNDYLIGKFSLSHIASLFSPATYFVVPHADVVGFIASSSAMKLMGGKSDKKARELILQDKSGVTMKVCLWEEQGELFDLSKIGERCVLVLSSVRVGEYNGEVSLASAPSTLIFYDLDIPEVRALKESNTVVSMTHTGEEDGVQFVDWQDYRRNTLQGIAMEYTENMRKGILYSCECVITAFHKKWSYLACERCLCKVEKNYRGVNTCKGCKVAEKTFQAYNATVEISDDTLSLEATIFSRTLETYFDFDIYDIPHLAYMKVALDSMFRDNLEGREGIFQITMTSRDRRMALAISKYAVPEDVGGEDQPATEGDVEEDQLEGSESDADDRGQMSKKRRINIDAIEESAPSLIVKYSISIQIPFTIQ
ncbi:hypothetical protein ACHQM5_013116 [Ranunculus cassubicifolius]